MLNERDEYSVTDAQNNINKELAELVKLAKIAHNNGATTAIQKLNEYHLDFLRVNVDNEKLSDEDFRKITKQVLENINEMVKELFKS